MKNLFFLLVVFAVTAMLTSCTSHKLVYAQASVKSLYPNCTDLPSIDSSLRFFPTDNPWNTEIDTCAVDPNSDKILDHQTGGPGINGIVYVELTVPYYVVSNAPLPVTVVGDPHGIQGGDYRNPVDTLYTFPELADKPPQASDPHLVILDQGTKKLYELYGPRPDTAKPETWIHNGAAVFDLTSNNLHTADGWTSADAAGLPILPGLLRYDELKRGAINHALRMTFTNTLSAHVYPPATHHPSDIPDTTKTVLWLPMGARLRLKDTVNVGRFPPEIQPIIRCLKKYGVIVADIGTNFGISGAADCKFSSMSEFRLDTAVNPVTKIIDPSTLRLLDKNGNDLTMRDFEVVKIGALSTIQLPKD